MGHSRIGSNTSWTLANGNGKICLALRRVLDDTYVSDMGRSSSGDGTVYPDGWEQASMNNTNIYSDTSFDQSSLYTLDLVDHYDGGWGWIAMDTVVITNARLVDTNFVIYNVTVSNGAFYIQDDTSTTEKPNLTFTDGTLYIFIQSDSTNANNQLVLGTTSDDNSSMINYQTIVGTPGRPGSVALCCHTALAPFYT